MSASWGAHEPVTSTLVIAEPLTAFSDGIAVVQNDVAGKIVLIARATVPSGEHQGRNGFSVKALAAQNAGAAAVIFRSDSLDSSFLQTWLQMDPSH